MIPKLVILATLALLLLPIAAAQSLEEPLVDHVDDKAASARSDPVGFAESHASEEAVAKEAEWGVAYGCFAAHYAHDEVGTPDPQLEQCEDYEEVLGIAPEPEEPVAVVQNLSEDPVAQVQEIEEEVLASVDDIVEDPLSAPEILIGLVLYLVDKVLDLIGGVGATATGVAAGALDLVGAALAADAKLGADMYDEASSAATASVQGVLGTASGLASGMLDVAAASIDGIVDGGKALGDGIADTAGTIGTGVADAADAVGDAAASIGAAVAGFVGQLFGGADKASEKGPVDDAAGGLSDGTDGLLDVVGDVGRVVAAV
ncbi:MAG TPA: hypothetical protein VGB18_01220 [Candidatus Thermoplasmatota archaeon]